MITLHIQLGDSVTHVTRPLKDGGGSLSLNIWYSYLRKKLHTSRAFVRTSESESAIWVHVECSSSQEYHRLVADILDWCDVLVEIREFLVEHSVMV